MIAARTLVLTFTLAVALGGDVVVGVGAPAAPRYSQWTEVKWPFPLDQWGTGRAFYCSAAHCGVEMSLYVRPKLGFCGCTSGVSDDEEVDRVGDLELLGPQFAGLAGGRAIAVGWMKGRSRLYYVKGPYQPKGQAFAIAFNDKCDVIVATVKVDNDVTRAEHEAIKFLNGDFILRWAAVELGL